MYVIKQWAKHFENNRSREVQKPSWVAQPNSHDTSGYRALVSRPDGPALYGVWCVLVQIASRCRPHGCLVKENGTPHTAESIALRSGMPVELVTKCLETIQLPEIDWVEIQGELFEQKPVRKHRGAQEGAVGAQEGAVGAQEGAVGAQVARAQQTDRQTDRHNSNNLLSAAEILSSAAVVVKSNNQDHETKILLESLVAQHDSLATIQTAQSLLDACRENSPSVDPPVLGAEVALVCHEKRSRNKGTKIDNPLGFLLITVPPCFPQVLQTLRRKTQ